MDTKIDAAKLADVLALMAFALRSQAQPNWNREPQAPAAGGAAAQVPRRPALRDHSNGQGQPVFINAARFVTVELCSAITGLSKGAVGKRIERGYWIEGRQFRRAEDGRIWIDMQAVERWVQGMS